MQTELDRIRLNNQGEIPNDGFVSFEARTANADKKLLLVKEVMSVIAEYDEESWPSDENWDKLLPNWFVNKTKAYSIEEVVQSNGRLWDYGSWLDAMKYRGWVWYSSLVKDSVLTVILKPYSYPFAVNPFEYLLLESGITEKIEYKDDTV